MVTSTYTVGVKQKKDVEVNDVVHYVRPDKFGNKHHLKAIVRSLANDNERWSADLELENEKLLNVPLALSREATTWHPIGGYGCETP